MTTGPGDDTGGDVSEGVGRGLDEVGGHLVEAKGVHDLKMLVKLQK